MSKKKNIILINWKKIKLQLKANITRLMQMAAVVMTLCIAHI